MLSTFLMTSALATGQVPAALPDIPAAMPIRRQAPAAAAPAPMPMQPMAMPKPMTGGVPMTAAPAPVVTLAPAPAAGAAPCATCDAAKADAPPTPPETKYFIEKLLEGSVAGQMLSDRGIKVLGWSNFSYTASSTSRSNGPVTFNDRANAFQNNQNWLEMSKAIDTSKKEVQFGFRSASLYGTDYRLTQARGLYNDRLNKGDYYGFDPVYAYGEVFLPNFGGEGTTIRAGRFPTYHSYEVIDAVNTPFLTKSYNFQYNPFTHTGVVATTQLDETWSMYHGAVTGSDVFIDPAARLTYLGGVKWAPKEGKTSVALNAVVGNSTFLERENFTHYNVYNLILTHKLTDELTYVLDTSFSHTNKVPGVGAAHWYGFANYFLYKVSDTVTSNLRFELFEDAQGVRTGFDGLYTEVTYGVSWTPQPWLIVRPSVRYDYNSDSRPFEGDHHLFTATMDVIIRW